MMLVRLSFVALLAAPTLAHAASPAQCTRTWNEEMAAHSTGADSYKTFMIACLHNRTSPTAPRIDRPAGAPANATARCRDGVYSYSSDAAQACIQHRGVQALLR
jgi:hypothetical protein